MAKRNALDPPRVGARTVPIMNRSALSARFDPLRRLLRRRRALAAGALLAGAAVVLIRLAFGASLTVTTISDVVDGDTSSIANLIAGPGADGLISLREAIIAANNTPGTDTIGFSIAGAGPHTIAPASALPTITDPLIIDGSSEPDFAGTPVIELNGSSAGGGSSGLTITAGSSTVRGLVINRFGGYGINMSASGSGNVIEGNYIGTNPAGTAALANGDHGIMVGGNNTTIGGTSAAARNVLSGNIGRGIQATTVSGLMIQGNRIGVNAAGSAVVPNLLEGITLRACTSSTIGGAAAGAGNLIGGNGPSSSREAVLITNGSSGIVVQGNWLGTDVTGTLNFANSYSGVTISDSTGNTIGGTAAGAGNLIAFNTAPGVSVRGTATGNTVQGNSIYSNTGHGVELTAGANNNTIGGTATGAGNLISGNSGRGIHAASVSGLLVQGNKIGVNAAGNAAQGNLQEGVVLATVTNSTIGGTVAGAGNVIGANGPGGTYVGIWVIASSSAIAIQGNAIGTDTTGTVNLGNNYYGIAITLQSNNITVGGTAAGAGNVIAFNTWGGVIVHANNEGAASGVTDNAILGNSIHSNTGLGIDLAPKFNTNAVNANDGAKNAGQPNLYMDYPVFTSASFVGGALTVAGYVGSAANQSTFAGSRVEIFIADTTAAGNGEGKTYLGYLTADASGNFSGTLTGLSGITGGTTRITATATDTANNTSEFGDNFTVAAATLSIAGTVFEDVNFGGGAGRSRGTALAGGGSGRSGARVELHTVAAGTATFSTFTTTDASGNYSFAGLADGSYAVRVVSSTVTSARTGYTAALLPVLVSRSEWNSESAWLVTDYVGGTNPAVSDAAQGASGATFNSTTGVFSAGITGTAQAFSPVTLGTGNASGVDFGFNFNTVANTNDSGASSLRQFITNANALSNTGLAIAGRTAGIDHAVFMISNGTAAAGLRAANNYFTGGVATISPTSELPDVTQPLVLDGQTQTGWSGTPIVELAGTSAGAGAHGLHFDTGSSGSTIRGLVVNRFGGDAITIGNSANSTVQGNYIGVDATGLIARANGFDGIWLTNADNNQIGGAAVSQRNLIGANGSNGIHLETGSTGNTIEGNYVGVGANGSTALPNAQYGIRFDATSGSNVIRTNVVSGNGYIGVTMASSSNTVHGNIIGLDAAGTTKVANGGDGISITGGNNNQIGGATAGTRNIISGNDNAADNSDGIWIQSGTGNVIQGNYIGTDITGTQSRPNYHSGVSIESSNNTVGGTGAGEGNLIAFNPTGVLVVSSATGNRILGNSIHSNTGIGIDLADDGVTANNGSKTAGQPNLLMDHPVFTVATVGGTTLTVAGYIGTAPNDTDFANARVEVFTSDNDASGFGEGQTYLGFLTADASGNFSGTLDVTGKGLAAGDKITGTASDTSNNTSEFGPNFIVGTGTGHWPLAETSGTTAIDLAAGNNGTYLNGVLLNRGAVGTCSIGSVQFDGVDDHVVIPHIAPYLLNNGTVAFWIKVDSLPGGRRGLFSKDSTGFDTGGHLTLWLNSNGTIHVRQQSTTASVEYNTTAAIQVGQWNHIAYTWGSAGMKVYVNGGTPASNAYAGGWGSSSGGIGNQQPIVLGANSWVADDLVANNLTDFFAGTMSDVRLVDRALSAAEIDTVRGCGPPQTYTISGTVFEDVHYGGGNGRNRATALAAGGSGRSGARVELYDNAGAFLSAAATDAGGVYSFGGNAAGSYTVRVVNETVTSSRAGYVASLRAVQTFRTDATSGTAADVYDFVGGRTPNLGDAGSNTTNATLASLTTATTTAQSVATVALSGADMTGMDFGFSFNVVVNTNNSGQGSLRQLITNAQALSNTGLAIDGRTAGIDHAVFMISNGTAAAGLRAANNYFTAGVATVSPTSALPLITQPLVLDAQTQPGWTGTPTVELYGAGAGGSANGLRISGGSSIVRGLIINRFLLDGIRLDTLAGNTIQGNWLGINNAGAPGPPYAENYDGIYVVGSNSNTIGGTSASHRNVVSGNTLFGLWLENSSNNTIQGNHFGTNPAGTVAIQNNWAGLVIAQGSSGNQIGGTTAGARNLISGNLKSGIWLVNPTVTGNVIEGNYIGVAADGTTALGNGSEGIRIEDSTSNNTIGGTGAGEGNLIAFNPTGVLVVSSATGNRILGNSIHSNTGIGIDLAGNGVTANDGSKTAGQPNLLMDHPVFTVATLTGATLAVLGYIGTAPTDFDFGNSRVEVFKSDNDGSGYGEGRTYLGFVTVFASGNFVGALDVTGKGLAAGDKITGTATDASNNTSEFGANFTTTVAAATISGTVFEDVHYGGGNGRNRATALAGGGSGRSGARVELYDNAGAFVSSTTTDVNGAYSFASIAAGSYTVRVVNETVTSARTGYVASLRSVQTFRTDASSGTAADVYDHVGGQTPNLVDAGSNTTNATLASLTTATTTAQSIASVALAGANIAAVDFGYSFNLVVNVNNSGQGSLRQLLTNANALSNTGLAIDGRTAGIDHAVFMISNGTAAAGLRAANNYFTAGVATVSPTSALPLITQPLVLDAQTQPGWTGAPIIELNGTGAGPVANGLEISAGSSIVRGLIINRFPFEGIRLISGSGNTVQGNWLGINSTGTASASNDNGIWVIGSGSNTIGGTSASHRNVASGNARVGLWLLFSSNNTVQGNHFGTNPAGTAAIANGRDGLVIESSGANNQIGGTTAGARNLISGNTQRGILLTGATVTGNIVEGNYIGVAADGSTAMSNGSEGVYVTGGASGNRFGGTTSGAGNVISGNGSDGVRLDSGASSVIIHGNFIGVNAAGTSALSNAADGVHVSSSSSTIQIGGAGTGERNTISGNGGNGVRVGGTSSAVTLRGNYIGLNAAGTAAVPNAANGLTVTTSVGGTQIGGSAAGEGNVISGNGGDGIQIGVSATGVLIRGNRIGTNAAGTAAVSNGSDGVEVNGSGHAIGGTAAGEGNVIAFNADRGVKTDGGSGHAILGNAIYGNGAIGIDLTSATQAANGVNANDGAVTAAQPNLLMDYAVFTSASWDGTMLRVRGYVGSAAGQSVFAGSRIEVFLSDNDASGYGEGRYLVGTAAADANGNFVATLTPPAGVTVAVGALVTGTATDGSNNTSEFGPNLAVRDYRPFRNGSFEDGDLGALVGVGDGSIWIVPAASTAIDYWVVGGVPIDGIPSSYWNASHGVRSIELNGGGGAGSIEQTFDTEPGATYSVFFDYAGSAACGPTRKSLRVSAAGTSQDVIDYLIGGGAVIAPATGSTNTYGVYYDTGLFRFAAVSDLTTLKFESLNGTVCGPIIDNVRVAAADPFVNGSFEGASVSPGGTYVTLAAPDTSITAWTVGGDSIDYAASDPPPSQGARAVALNGNAAGSVAQTFDAIPGAYLRARFDFATSPAGPVGSTIQTTAAGTAQDYSLSAGAAWTWTPQSFVFLPQSEAITLSFISQTAGATGPAIDNVLIEDALPFINGSFEDVRFPLRDSTDLTADTKLIRGWVTSGTSLQHWGSASFAPSLGGYSVHLNGPAGAGTIAQTFDVIAGQSYDVLFDAAANPSLAADQSLRATIVDGGVTISTRNVTLNPANVLPGQTRWRTQQISFTATGSRVTLAFESQTAGNRGLVLDNVRYGVLGTLNTTGQFNAFETGTPANAITGVIKTEIVGVPFTLDIAAIRLDKTGYSNYPMSGIKVELVDSTDNAAPLDEVTNCRASWTSVATITSSLTLAGPDNGRKAQSFTVGNAYRNLRVKLSYPGSGAATVVGCSNDNFAVRPAWFAGFVATDNDDSSAGTARVLNNAGAGGVVHRAGRPFTVIARAVDGANNTVTNYDGAPQLAVAACVVPAGCTAGALAGSATTTAGSVTGNAFTYSEAGSISVQLEDAMFADADAGDSTQDERSIRLAAPATIGRFIADRYRLTTATAPAMAHAGCGAGPGAQTFTFVGQNFGFAAVPVVRATPLNAAGAAINNARPVFGAPHVGSSFVAVGAPLALGGSASIGSIAAGADALITFAASSFSFARDANTPIASFAPTFTLTVNVADTSESGATGPINSETPLAMAGIGFAGGTGNNLHYGRLILRPAYADLRSDIYLPLEIQRYTGLGWQALPDAGACVSATASAFAYSQATGLLNGGAGASNCTSRVLNDVTTAGGRASIRLPKPAGGAVPSAMTVTLNTGAAAGSSCSGAGTAIAATSANLPWLAGAAGAAPSARVSWGAPRSDYLMLREKFD